MNILSIETSCDETAVSVLTAEGEKEHPTFRVLGDALYSQASKHAAYGGVYPTLAKREHQKNLVPLTHEALSEADLLEKGETVVPENSLEHAREDEFKQDVSSFLRNTQKPNLDCIAVTHGPGLEPALWTGVAFANILGSVWNIPVIGINHMEGHILSAVAQKNETGFSVPQPTFPMVSLLISGGHTELVAMNDWFVYELIGRTRDDAVGEAFDKVARLLNYPYPGGPAIDQAAERSRERGENPHIELPRPMLNDGSCDFSFSGLKTAVLYLIRDQENIDEQLREDIANEFTQAVREVLVQKTKRALEQTGARTLVVSGGVSASTYLREGIESLVETHSDVTLHYPEKGMTGDNAVMIGIAAYLRHVHGYTSQKPVTAKGSLSLA